MKNEIIIKGKAKGSVAFTDKGTIYGGIELGYAIHVKDGGTLLTISAQGIDVTVNLKDITDGIKDVVRGIKDADI